MPDWDCVNGMAEDYGFGDPDMDLHDPAGHCVPLFSGGSVGGFSRGVFGLPLVCKHCGSRSVYWRNTPRGYRLHNKSDFKIHLCHQQEQRNAEGFDDVD